MYSELAHSVYGISVPLSQAIVDSGPPSALALVEARLFIGRGFGVVLGQNIPILSQHTLGSLDRPLDLGEEIIIVVDSGIGLQLIKRNKGCRVAFAVT